MTRPAGNSGGISATETGRPRCPPRPPVEKQQPDDPLDTGWLLSAKKQAEAAWEKWLWETDTPHRFTLEDFYRQIGIPVTDDPEYAGMIPSLSQLVRDAHRAANTRPSEEEETLYPGMTDEKFLRLWYQDDPEWNNGVRDGDAARAEQRAGKKYQETKESRQIAEDASVRSALEEKFAEKRWEAEENDRIADGMSTQAAIDEKLAIRKALASAADSGYTESEQEARKFWEWLLNNDSFYSPYQNVQKSAIEKGYQNNLKIENVARSSSTKAEYGSSAFDNVGHINGQAHPSIGNMRFGNSTVAASGCGAIAIYNLLQDLGKTSVTLSEVIQTAEKNNYMLCGGILGITPKNLSNLMDDYGIEHREVNARELQQMQENGEIADGTKYVVAVSNSAPEHRMKDFIGYAKETHRFSFDFFGNHNYEMVYDSRLEMPWTIFNLYSTAYETKSRQTLEDLIEHSMDQYLAVYEVEE